MKIELDTNCLSDIDRKLLLVLAGVEVKEKIVELPIVKEVLKSSGYIRGKHGNLQAVIIEVLKNDSIGMLTVNELSDKTGAEVQSLYNKLAKMKIARIIDRDSSIPTHYFLRERGNPDIKEFIKLNPKIEMSR